MNTQFLIKICRFLRDWRKQTTQVKQRKIQHNTFGTEAYNLFTEFEWSQFRKITFYFSYLGFPRVIINCGDFNDCTPNNCFTFSNLRKYSRTGVRK